MDGAGERGKNTGLKPIIRALKGDVVTPFPVWMMRQAGRYLPEYRRTRTQARNFLDFCYTPDLAVEVTLQPLDRFAFDAGIIFSDILVVPDAMGQKVEFVEGRGPVLEPLVRRADVDKLKTVGVLDHLSPVFEAISRVRASIGRERALIGFSGAPWTLAYYMIEGSGGSDGAKLKRIAYSEPEAFAALIAKLVDVISVYLCQQVKAGAEILQIFDSWAGIASTSLFRRWLIEPTAEIVRRVRLEHPDVPIIGFPRNGGLLYETYVLGTDVDGVSLDSSVPLHWALRNFPSKVTLQGNLDNQVLVAGGQALDQEVDMILKSASGFPFVFNLGHGILPETPPENVAAVLSKIKSIH